MMIKDLTYIVRERVIGIQWTIGCCCCNGRGRSGRKGMEREKLFKSFGRGIVIQESESDGTLIIKQLMREIGVFLQVIEGGDGGHVDGQLFQKILGFWTEFVFFSGNTNEGNVNSVERGRGKTSR
jgi:hypothetical protein